MKRRTGIYKIKNIITEKVYVGSAIDIDKRWRKHKQMINEGNHHSIKLQNSMNKHGISKFIFEIIEECEKELLIEREQYWINVLDSYNNGYNSRPIAHSNLGIKLPISEETKRKIGLKSKGRKHTEETRKKIKEKRKLQIFTEETRKKLSKIHSDKKWSEESKEKMRKSMKGKSPINKGKTYEELYGKEKAEELKMKRRITASNKKLTEESRGKINKNKKGKTYEEIYGEEKAKEIKMRISRNYRKYKTT